MVFSRAAAGHCHQAHKLFYTLQHLAVRHADTHDYAVGAHVHNHEEADTQLGLPGAGAAAHEQAASH